MKVKRFRFRLVILLILIFFGLLFLILRLRKLQIDNQSYWQENVPGEKLETIRLPSVRGNITDRNGLVLASNKKNYELDINLEAVKQFYQEGWDTPLEREKIGRREKGMRGKTTETDIAAIATVSYTHLTLPTIA